MSVTLLKAAQIVTLDGDDNIFQPGYLVLEDDRIVELGRGEQLSRHHFDNEIDLGRRLLMPGLVNAHTHSPMVLFRGSAEGHSLFDFEGWYTTIRVLEEQMAPEMISAAVAVSCAEMIRTGTTCFADQYFWMDWIVPQVRQSGLRAALAYGVVELGDDGARQQEIAAATRFLRSVANDTRLTGWVGPHAFFVDNSEAAIDLELALADQFQTGLHIHLATSGEEDRYCQEHYGCSAVHQMERMGILDRPLLAAHCLTVPLEDLPLLARRPFTAVIAPSSAMRNAAGVAPVLAMVEADVNLALGTDNVTNNNSYDLFKEMQLLGKLMALQARRPNALPTRSILKMATEGGARALGLADEIGSLEVGKKADLITLDLDEIGWTPLAGQDIYTALVYAVSGMHVCDVMVDGNWLYRNNRWLTLDYAAARAQLEQDYARLQAVLAR